MSEHGTGHKKDEPNYGRIRSDIVALLELSATPPHAASTR